MSDSSLQGTCGYIQLMQKNLLGTVPYPLPIGTFKSNMFLFSWSYWLTTDPPFIPRNSTESEVQLDTSATSSLEHNDAQSFESSSSSPEKQEVTNKCHIQGRVLESWALMTPTPPNKKPCVLDLMQ